MAGPRRPGRRRGRPAGRTEAVDPVSASYQREAEAFLRLVRGEGAAPVDGRAGLASLRLADAIRAAGAAAR